jgi:hypothetical protein
MIYRNYLRHCCLYPFTGQRMTGPDRSDPTGAAVPF